MTESTDPPKPLGLDMPRIRWSDLWPVVLIVLGGVMLYRSATRRT